MWTPSSKHFCEALGVSVPIVQAPMAGGPTTPDLVAAVSNAGGLGSIGAGYLTPDALDAQIGAVQDRTDRPFSVNIFSLLEPVGPVEIPQAIKQALLSIQERTGAQEINFGARFDPVLDEQIRVLIERRIQVVSFAFGILPEKAIEALKQAGAKIVGTATSPAEAVRLERARCDAVVVQGFEAGGHRGGFDDPPSLIGLFALVPLVARKVSVPVVASGGIMTGEGIAAALMLGASAVQMGTAFLVTEESGAPAAWKERLLATDDDGTAITKSFSGKPARGIVNSFIEHFRELEDQVPVYPIQNSLTGPIRRAAKDAADAGNMSLWAGQGRSMSRSMSAAALMDQLIRETDSALSSAAPTR